MDDGANPVHHVFEEVREICDRVGVGLQLDILEEPLQRCLSIEFSEGDGMLRSGAGAGAAGGGMWGGIVGRFDVDGCSGGLW